MMRAILLSFCIVLAAGSTEAQSLPGQEPKILALTKGSWAYFRDYNGRQLIYFTHLEAYRCGISKVRYSLDSPALDREWKLQPCDRKEPTNITTDKPYISLAPGTANSIFVQLTFNDGSKSQLVRIDSSNQLIR
jgi:hypothetical protein